MTKILLVEDDKSLREIYGVRLLAEGYDIVSAGDGEEALAMAIKERPALIVSDVMMPKISGFDMLDILRSATETKDIKVIMMTALSSEDQRQRGESLGADRYLVKSQVGIEDVVRTVHEVLGDLPGVGTDPIPTKQPNAAPAAPTPQRPATRPDVASLSPQPSLTPTHIPTTQAPQPAPTAPIPGTQPVAVAQQPAAPVTPQPAAPALPQPTAPFSSSTPRPNSLGDRVIQPLSSPEEDTVNVAQLIEQELNMPTIAPTPAAESPEAPVANDQTAEASAPIPQSTETPDSAAPTPQPAPTAPIPGTQPVAVAQQPAAPVTPQPAAPAVPQQTVATETAIPTQPMAPPPTPNA